jgi:hypothetical protein
MGPLLAGQRHDEEGGQDDAGERENEETTCGASHARPSSVWPRRFRPNVAHAWRLPPHHLET